jgi:hypothetical protein
MVDVLITFIVGFYPTVFVTTIIIVIVAVIALLKGIVEKAVTTDRSQNAFAVD